MQKLSLLAVALLFTAASAQAQFDPNTGTGFVGKGEVQLALSYNNKQLQDNAGSLVFTAVSVTETTWECLNRGGNTAYKSSEIRTEGVVSAVARDRNQITGFILSGWTGNPTVEVDGDDGQPGTCPSSQTFIEGSIETGEASGYTLFVNDIAL